MSEAKFTPDAYSQAVEYLTENPEKISSAWYSPRQSPGGCLFYYVKPHRADNRPGWSPYYCGCLTMVHDDYDRVAWTPELTAAIKGDRRIPSGDGTYDAITVDLLPLFAGWQRRIDQALGRTPPPLDPRLPAPKGDIEIPAIEFGLVGGSISPTSAQDDLGAAVRQQTPA